MTRSHIHEERLPVRIDYFDLWDAAPASALWRHAELVFLDGFAKDVVINGSRAYATDMPTGFYVLDLSEKTGEPSISLQYS
jgi:hypothetical protein